MNKESVYKVLLLGDTNVGKTCFLFKYTDNTFHENHIATIGLDYRVKKIKLKNGKEISLQIWDTAGQDRFRAITKNYYKGAHGIVLIYDITNNQTFEKLDFWYNIVKESCDDALLAIIGNKKDLYEEEQINEEDAIKKAESFNATFGLTSALEEDTGFDEIITKVIKTYIQNKGESVENKLFKTNSNNFKLDSSTFKEKNKKKKKFC